MSHSALKLGPSLSQEQRKVAQKTAAVLVGTAGLMSSPTLASAALIKSPWDSEVLYDVVKSNSNGDVPKIGDLVAIRFKGSYKGNVFDDVMKTEQPYFYRCGVGLILKGIDDAVTHMHVGDDYILQFGGDRAFGEKGRSSAPGKPRIPPNAVLDYEVVLEALPGKGDDFIADVEE